MWLKMCHFRAPKNFDICLKSPVETCTFLLQVPGLFVFFLSSFLFPYKMLFEILK